jgi:hypothetical protein
MKNHEVMIISALRYALDRRSYIMSCTEDYIRGMLKGEVSESFLKVCMDDIKTEMRDRVRLNTDTSGMHDWKPLLEELIRKVNKKV